MLVAMKMMQASQALLEEHYGDLSKKPFFPGLVKYMASGPVVAMGWEGLNAVKTGRLMLGSLHRKRLLSGSRRRSSALGPQYRHPGSTNKCCQLLLVLEISSYFYLGFLFDSIFTICVTY